jgi:hypothetical protein
MKAEKVVSIRYNYWLVAASLNCEGQNKNSRTIIILHYIVPIRAGIVVV